MTTWETDGDVPNEEEEKKLYPCSSPVLNRMADVESRSVGWLWNKRIAFGRISLFVGFAGLGKSFITCDFASRVSTGTPFPDGSPCEKGSVILISCEDDPHDTIRPGLDAHHADVSKIYLLSAIKRTDERGKESESVFMLSDVDMLEEAIKLLTDQLRQAIDDSGVTRYRIAKETGISESALAQFYNGHRGLSMKAMNALGECLELKITMHRKPSKPKRK